MAQEFLTHQLPHQFAVHNLKLEVSVITGPEGRLLTMQLEVASLLQSTF
jgi:hypothetical protein